MSIVDAKSAMSPAKIDRSRTKLLPPEEVNPAWKDNWGERAAWSRRKIRRNIEGYFDMFDRPWNAQPGLTLERLGEPDQTVDPAKDFPGKPVMVVFVVPSAQPNWRPNAAGVSIPAQRYWKLYEEFRDQVDFVTVFSDQARRNPDMARRRKEAEAFAKTIKLPGLLTVQGGKARLDRFVGPGITMGCAFNSGVTAIRDQGGNVVFREHNFGFNLEGYRLMLKRALDRDFDAQVRAEFADQTRHLPNVEKLAKGLAYTEDFESYKDGFGLKLSPRWSFHYEIQYRINARADLVGPDGGKAARLYSDYYKHHEGGETQKWRSCLEHDLPVPLRSGYFSFRMKPTALGNLRTKLVSSEGEWNRYRGRKTTSLIVTFRQPESIAASGYLLVKNNTFLLVKGTPHIRDISEKGPIPAARDKWYTITVLTTPGKKAEVLVGDTSFGTLDSEAFLGITFRCRTAAEFLLDDVGAFYAGNADALLREHQAYVEATKKVQVGEAPYPYTDEQISKFNLKPFSPDAQMYKMHAPIQPNGRLVLERMYRPGQYVDPIAESDGRPIYFHNSKTRSPELSMARYGEMAPGDKQVRKILWDTFHERVVFYDLTMSTYHEYCFSSHEETRELCHEQIMAKKRCRELFGKAVAWECCAEIDEGHYLMRPFIDPRCALWAGIDLRSSYMSGGHGHIRRRFVGAVVNRRGDIILRTRGESPYRDGILAMHAALDEKFQTSLSMNFGEGSPLPKKPILPIVKKTDAGTVYRDDFENYEDNADLWTHPRWGFTYRIETSLFHGENEKLYGDLADGEGREASTALLLDNSHYFVRSVENVEYGPHKSWRPKHWREGTKRAVNRPGKRHVFPEELTTGYFRMFVRQGPKISQKRRGGADISNDDIKDQWFALDLLGEDGKRFGSIIGRGVDGMNTMDSSLAMEKTPDKNVSIAVKDWKKDQFGCLYPKDAAWHEIKVIARPGQDLTVTVDGKSIGTVASRTLCGVDFYARAADCMYVDDVEIFYEK